MKRRLALKLKSNEGKDGSEKGRRGARGVRVEDFQALLSCRVPKTHQRYTRWKIDTSIKPNMLYARCANCRLISSSPIETIDVLGSISIICTLSKVRNS